MKIQLKSLVVSFVLFPLFIAQGARAAVFTLPTIETSMSDPIFETLAASFAFRPMEPASDLGAKWGFYLGVGGSATSTALVSNIFTSLPTSYVPNADLQLGIGLPKGFTIEMAAIPNVSYSGDSFSKWDFALKWTLSRSLWAKLPFSLAVRAQYGTAKLNFVQPVSGGTATFDYSTSSIGGNIVASKYLGAVGFGLEPYVGVGLLTQSSALAVTGTGTAFGSSYPSGTQSISASGLSSWLQVGMLLKLGVFAITGEYDRFFGLSSYSTKVSIRF